MRAWTWLTARPSALRALVVCATSGLIKSLAMPLATWAIFARPEGVVFAVVAAAYIVLLYGIWWVGVRSSDAVHREVDGEIHRARLALVDRVRQAELGFVEKNRQTIADAMNDVDDLHAISSTLPGLVRAAFELAGYLAYAVVTSGAAALALVAGLGWLARGMRRHARAQRSVLSGFGPLDGVGYRFDEGFELGPVSLTVEPGELVFVVGHNGSGKTTLMKVISGLYPTHGGAVRLGGAPVRRADLRAAFTVAFIDAYLFDRAYGLDVEDLELEDALAEVGLGDVVGVSGGRFDTLELSTGQQRRLALAIALLEDRPFVVFDEWDAHQDPETRRWYFETLLPRLAREGRAVIAVCHDDRFFATADRVIELRHGRLHAVRPRPAA